MSEDHEEYVDESFTDTVGGVHDGGVGWNPHGLWCGECCSRTCDGCDRQHELA